MRRCVQRLRLEKRSSATTAAVSSTANTIATPYVTVAATLRKLVVEAAQDSKKTPHSAAAIRLLSGSATVPLWNGYVSSQLPLTASSRQVPMKQQFDEAALIIHNAQKLGASLELPTIQNVLRWFEQHQSQIASYGSMVTLCNFGKGVLLMRGSGPAGLDFVLTNILPMMCGRLKLLVSRRAAGTTLTDVAECGNIGSPKSTSAPFVFARHLVDSIREMESHMKATQPDTGSLSTIHSQLTSILASASALAAYPEVVSRLDAMSWTSILLAIERCERLVGNRVTQISKVVMPHFQQYVENARVALLHTQGAQNDNGFRQLLQPRVVAGLLSLAVRFHSEMGWGDETAMLTLVSIMSESARRSHTVSDVTTMLQALSRYRSTAAGRRVPLSDLRTILSRIRGPLAQHAATLYAGKAVITMQALSKLRVPVPAGVLLILCERLLTMNSATMAQAPTKDECSDDAVDETEPSAVAVRLASPSKDANDVMQFVVALGKCVLFQQQQGATYAGCTNEEYHCTLAKPCCDVLQFALQIWSTEGNLRSLSLVDCAQLIEGFTMVARVGIGMDTKGSPQANSQANAAVLSLLKMVQPTLQSALYALKKMGSHGRGPEKEGTLMRSISVHSVLSVTTALIHVRSCVTLTFDDDQLLASLEQLRKDLLFHTPALLPDAVLEEQSSTAQDVAQLLSVIVDETVNCQTESRRSPRPHPSAMMGRTQDADEATDDRTMSRGDDESTGAEDEVVLEEGFIEPQHNLVRILGLLPSIIRGDSCTAASLSAFAKSLTRIHRHKLLPKRSDAFSCAVAAVALATVNFHSVVIPCENAGDVHPMVSAIATSFEQLQSDGLEPDYQMVATWRTAFLSCSRGVMHPHEFVSLSSLLLLFDSEGQSCGATSSELLVTLWTITLARVVALGRSLSLRDLRNVMHLLTHFDLSWVRKAVASSKQPPLTSTLIMQCHSIYEAAAAICMKRVTLVLGEANLNEASAFVASLNAIRLGRGETHDDAPVVAAVDPPPSLVDHHAEDEGDVQQTEEEETEGKAPDGGSGQATWDWETAWGDTMRNLNAHCCHLVKQTAPHEMSVRDARWMLKLMKGFREASVESASRSSSSFCADDELSLLYASLPLVRRVATELTAVELSIALHCFAGAGAWNIRLMKPLLDVACDGLIVAPLRPTIALLLSLIRSRFLRQSAVLQVRNDEAVAISAARSCSTSKAVGMDDGMERLVTQLCMRIHHALASPTASSTWRPRELVAVVQSLGWFDHPPQPLFDAAMVLLLELTAHQEEAMMAPHLALLRFASKAADRTLPARIYSSVWTRLATPDLRGQLTLSPTTVKPGWLESTVNVIATTMCVVPSPASREEAARLLAALVRVVEELQHSMNFGVVGRCTVRLVEMHHMLASESEDMSDALRQLADHVSTKITQDRGHPSAWSAFLQLQTLRSKTDCSLVDIVRAHIVTGDQANDVLHWYRRCRTTRDRVIFAFSAVLMEPTRTSLACFAASVPQTTPDVLVWMLRVLAAIEGKAPLSGAVADMATMIERTLRDAMREDVSDVREWVFAITSLIRDPTAKAFLTARGSLIMARLPALVERMKRLKDRNHVSLSPWVLQLLQP